MAVGAPSPSLIGDELLRELIEQPGPGRERDAQTAATAEPRPPVPERNGAAHHEIDSGVADTVVFELDPRHDSTVVVPPVRPTRSASDEATGRHRPTDRSPETPAPDGDRRQSGGPRLPSATDTDGLGIGDLLAGALAAYRGI